MKAFGDHLRQTREAKGVSVDSVARSTRISERYLHALERSDLEALPGGIFDKGYIKAYAQFLDIDPDPLLESYAVEEEKLGRGTPDDERQKSEDLSKVLSRTPPARGSRSSRGGVSLALVAIGLVSAAAWLTLRGTSPPEYRAENRAENRPENQAEPPIDEPLTVTRSLSASDAPAPPAVEREVDERSEPTEPTEPSEQGASNLTVADAATGTGVVDRDLVGRGDRFAEGASVWFWTRVVGGGDGERIRHVWMHDGRVHMNAELPIDGAHWRTYSNLELPLGTAGEWTLEVRGADGAVLATATFQSVAADVEPETDHSSSTYSKIIHDTVM